ncbi:MAG: acyl carrier protein [Chloroflexi bacterium]|nr:MAG: acyl carrier protein [Chloroflexota bacterium]
MIDSMGVMELIAFLRDEFGIAVADEDITESNLGTMTDIARYVSTQRGNGNGAR